MTILNEKGIGLVELKQHGRWKTTLVYERFIDNTACKKMKTSNMIQNNFKLSEELISGEANTFTNYLL